MVQSIKNFFGSISATTAMFVAGTVIVFSFVLPAIYNRFH